MIRVYLFEWHKVWKNRKNQMILVLFILCTVSMFFYYQHLSKDYIEQQQKECEKKTTTLISNIANLKNQLLKSEDLSPDTIERLEKEVAFLNFEQTQFTMMGFYYKEAKVETNKNVLIAQNKLYANRISTLEKDPIIKDLVLREMGKLSVRDMEKNILINNYVLDHNLIADLNPYFMTGAKVVKMFFTGWNIMALTLLATLVVVDMYLGEMSEGSYKLTYTQPFTRRQIYWSKVMALTTSVMAMFGVALGGIVILATIINGPGQWQYPIMTRMSLYQVTHHTLTSQAMLIPSWQYVFCGGALLLSVVSMALMVTWYVSLKTDSNSAAMGASVLFIVLAFAFSMFVGPSSMLYLLFPYMYLGVDRVLAVDTQGSLIIGLVLNTLVVLLLQQLSLGCFLKKDLLGVKE